MSKVVKQNGVFKLSPAPGQMELAAAREQHSVEMEIVSNGKPDAGALSVIICHLLLRIKALESQNR